MALTLWPRIATSVYNLSISNLAHLKNLVWAVKHDMEIPKSGVFYTSNLIRKFSSKTRSPPDSNDTASRAVQFEQDLSEHTSPKEWGSLRGKSSSRQRYIDLSLDLVNAFVVNYWLSSPTFAYSACSEANLIDSAKSSGSLTCFRGSHTFRNRLSLCHLRYCLRFIISRFALCIVLIMQLTNHIVNTQ